MFGGSTSTEYDDIVAKTTDENLTSENWEMILNLCDKVGEEGEAGAHAVVVALLKRLTHRNPNVQLYALSLSDSLSKNLGIEVHRQIASRAFTQGLEKLITDRNTHAKVRRRALALVAEWTADFEHDESLGIMEDCYNNLKSKNYKFDQAEEAPAPTVDVEALKKEEEELLRVLEMSKNDLGRPRWEQYSLATPGGAGPSSSSTSAPGPSGAGSSSAAGASTGYSAPKYQGGYVPARTPTPERMAAQQRQQQQDYEKQLQAQQRAQHQREQEEAARQRAAAAAAPTPVPQQTPVHTSAPAPATLPAGTTGASTANSTPAGNVNIVTRVRALYTFEPTEPGELAFDQGDIIKVVDRGYKDWWRGQIKGRTGIFPVNYVEAMPEPSVTELAKEAEQEAAVFAQAINVEKLLNMLRALDPVKDNLADNEEIQELYRSSMALRPKIVKLIDKYSQKRADLVSMNETFLRARNIFDRMMEESLARHTGLYDQQPSFRPQGQFQQGRPQSAIGGPQYSWGPGFAPPGHIQPQGTPAPGGYNNYAGSPAPSFPIGPQPTATPAPGLQHQQQPQQPQQHGQPGPYGGAPGQQPQGFAPQQGSLPQNQPQQAQAPAATPDGFGVMAVGGYAGHQPNTPYTQQGPTPYPAQAQQQPLNQPVQEYQPQQQAQPQQPQTYQQPQQQQAQPYQQQQQQQPVQGQQPQVQSYQQVPSQAQHQTPQAQPYQPAPAQAQPQTQTQSQSQTQAKPPLQPQPYQQPMQNQPQTQPQPYQPPPPQEQPQTQISPVQQVQPYQQPIQQHPGLSPQPSYHQPGPVAASQPQPEPQAQSPVQPAQIQPAQVQPAQVQPAQVQPIQTQHVAQAEVQPQVQPHVQPQVQTQVESPLQSQLHLSQPAQQSTPQPQPQPQQQQQQPQPDPQPQSQAPTQAPGVAKSAPAQPISGPPPYPFDPSYTYADPNVQAWASYYSQGGTDLAGAVYFISIPGVKEEAPATSPVGQAGQPNGGVARQATAIAGQSQPSQQPQGESLPLGQVSPQRQNSLPGAQVQGEQPYGGQPIGAGPSTQAAPHGHGPGQPLSQFSNMPRYQLSDGPGPVSQQFGNGSEVSPTSASPSNLNIGATPVTALHVKRGQSPNQGTSPVPSWVLPKKGNTPGFGSASGSPPAGGAYFQSAVGS